MTKVTLIGVTHIDKESQVKVEESLQRINPEAVCLELDEYRLQALLENEELTKSYRVKNSEEDKQGLNETLNLDQSNSQIIEDSNGVQSDIEEDWFLEEPPSFYSSILEGIGFFENELAKVLQTEQPGKEMIVAYKAAKKIGAKIYLIDQSIKEIGKVLEEEVSEEEADKFQTMVDEVLFQKKVRYDPKDESELSEEETTPKVEEEREETTNDSQKQNQILALGAPSVRKEEGEKRDENENEEEEEGGSEETLDLEEVLEIFKDEESLMDILSVFSESFPKLYSVLLDDRNDFMVKQILKIVRKHDNIVIILGYGHVLEIGQMLQQLNEDLEIEIIN